MGAVRGPAGPPPIVLVVMGVTGTGKSKVAARLAEQLGWDLQEGDDLHPPGNVAKMSAGQPLTDDDRWPWLDAVARWIVARTAAGRPGIITCSALKRAYRDRLAGPRVVFVHLTGTKEQLEARLADREYHFMPASLLLSQLQALEPLGPGEPGLVVSVDQTVAQEVAEIVHRLGLGA